MSTCIGVARGNFGILAADTRFMMPSRGVVSDVGEWGRMTPRGRQVYVDADRRKMSSCPGPCWAGVGGQAAETAMILLGWLYTAEREPSVRDVLEKLNEAPAAARKLLESWGLRVRPEQVAGLAEVGAGFLRAEGKHTEFYFVTRETGKGGRDLHGIWPPAPLTSTRTEELRQAILSPVVDATSSTPAELLLAVARALEAMREAGAHSISGLANVGLLLALDDRVCTAQVNFTNAELLERWPVPELDAKLEELLRDGEPLHGWDPEPMWLTPDPVSR